MSKVDWNKINNFAGLGYAMKDIESNSKEYKQALENGYDGLVSYGSERFLKFPSDLIRGQMLANPLLLIADTSIGSPINSGLDWYDSKVENISKYLMTDIGKKQLEYLDKNPNASIQDKIENGGMVYAGNLASIAQKGLLTSKGLKLSKANDTAISKTKDYLRRLYITNEGKALMGDVANPLFDKLRE